MAKQSVKDKILSIVGKDFPGIEPKYYYGKSPLSDAGMGFECETLAQVALLLEAFPPVPCITWVGGCFYNRIDTTDNREAAKDKPVTENCGLVVAADRFNQVFKWYTMAGGLLLSIKVEPPFRGVWSSIPRYTAYSRVYFGREKWEGHLYGSMPKEHFVQWKTFVSGEPGLCNHMWYIADTDKFVSYLRGETK